MRSAQLSVECRGWWSCSTRLELLPVLGRARSTRQEDAREEMAKRRGARRLNLHSLGIAGLRGCRDHVELQNPGVCGSRSTGSHRCARRRPRSRRHARRSAGDPGTFRVVPLRQPRVARGRFNRSRRCRRGRWRAAGLYGASPACLSGVTPPSVTYAGDPGLTVGSEAAQALVLLHRPAFMTSRDPFVGGTEPGQWRPTPGITAGANVYMSETTPFTLNSSRQFRPSPPPPLKSQRYFEDTTR